MTLALLGLGFNTATARPADFSGAISSELYVFDASTETQVQLYERLRTTLTAWRGAHNRTLSIHMHLRWTHRFADLDTDAPELAVYSAYARLKGLPAGASLDLGRQFVYTGVGSATVDGLGLRYGGGRRLRLDLFAGSDVSPSEPDKVQSPSTHPVIAGRVSVALHRTTQLGLGWMRREYAGLVELHRVGLDAQYRQLPWRTYSQVSLDLDAQRLAQVLMRLSFETAPWYLCGEFSWRKPGVQNHTLFSLIEFDPYREVRIELRRRLAPALTAVAQYDLGLFDADDSHRFSLGISSRMITLTGYRQMGYRGDRLGARGLLRFRLGSRWEGFTSADVSRYRVQDEQEDKSDAHTGSLGMAWRPRHGLTARIEGQYLRHAVRASDWRLLVRLTKAFAANSQPAGSR